MGFVGRLFQDPPIELQPGQLSVDKSAGTTGKVVAGSFPCDRFRYRSSLYSFFQNNNLAAISHGRSGLETRMQ
jgi:hypothetical protein